MNAMESPLTTHLGRTFRIPADMDLGLTFEKESGKSLKAKDIPKEDAKFAKVLSEIIYELKSRE